MQIMAEAEDDENESNEAGATNGKDVRTKANNMLETLGLGDADISQNVYEGGFKSWEGAMDLARLLLERGPRKDIDDLERCDGVIEVSLKFAGRGSMLTHKARMRHRPPISHTLPTRPLGRLTAPLHTCRLQRFCPPSRHSPQPYPRLGPPTLPGSIRPGAPVHPINVHCPG